MAEKVKEPPEATEARVGDILILTRDAAVLWMPEAGEDASLNVAGAVSVSFFSPHPANIRENRAIPKQTIRGRTLGSSTIALSQYAG